MLNGNLPEVGAMTSSSSAGNRVNAHQSAAVDRAAFLLRFFAMVVLVAEVGVAETLSRFSRAETVPFYFGSVSWELARNFAFAFESPLRQRRGQGHQRHQGAYQQNRFHLCLFAQVGHDVLFVI